MLACHGLTVREIGDQCPECGGTEVYVKTRGLISTSWGKSSVMEDLRKVYDQAIKCLGVDPVTHLTTAAAMEYWRLLQSGLRGVLKSLGTSPWPDDEGGIRGEWFGHIVFAVLPDGRSYVCRTVSDEIVMGDDARVLIDTLRQWVMRG